jgi:DNA polymerase III epsilon subunit family exonuclease
MNIARELTKQQAEAVYHYKGPVLVLAGPGSGKTRVITYRVAYLIRHHNVPPESILAVTFTNKAAQEMMNRLHNDDLLGETIGVEVWIHTFHAACVRILREYGDKIGLNPNFAIIDQGTQEEIISRCIRDFGPSISENQVWVARDFISGAKIKLKDPIEPHDTDRLNRLMEDEDSIMTMNDLLEVARRYQEYLNLHEALDYDDLVCKTVNLLSDSVHVRDELRKRFQFIMVDEYQDINLAQYELIRHLCNTEENIMVVADDDQSIYSWRGSDPSFMDQFKEQYNPRIIQLVDHFRSTKNLLRASQSLIGKNTRRKKGSLITDNDSGSVVYHYKLDAVEEELRLVAWLINKLIREKHYSPGQIAVFYRTHRLADKLEQYLLERRIEVRRIRPESFFEDNIVRPIVDYLRLICWHPELYMNRIVNFPDTVMDELTKLQLERITKKSGVGFGDLMRNIAASETPLVHVGPLTKHRIQRFISVFDGFNANPKDESASEVVRRLLEFLESERSPYHSADLAVIQSPAGSGSFWLAVNALYGTIQQGQPVSVIAAYGIDNYSAAGIIMHVLQNYLNMGERITCQFLPPDGAPRYIEQEREEGVLYIVIGSLDNVPKDIVERAILIGIHAQEEPTNCIASLPAGEGGVVSTTALKFCQRLLSSYEAGNTDALVVYDLETTGNNPKTAEIIEIAAKKIGSRGEDGRFHQLVKPKRRIPRFSTDIHGITNEDVRGEPGIEEVLPSFLDFIGDSVLVGHNIKEFDNRVIARYMAAYMGRSELPNSSYDTLSVAKRLFPLENYRLDVLADKFDISYDGLHRADDDVELSDRIFRRLRREDLMQSERKSLPEVLSLVAIGILEKNAAMEEENAAFYNAALRYLRQKRRPESQKASLPVLRLSGFPLPPESISGAIELLPISHLEAAEEEEAIRFLDLMRKEDPPDTKDDMDWNATKAKLQNVVLDFERSSYDKSLNAFLGYAALFTNVDMSEENGHEDKVTMMTAHSAKGTEFPVVIMIGMEQGNFPLLRPDQSDEELEEERRLCYVGMTRAKRQLYMTSVKRRIGDIEKTPSQFIWEIQPDLVKTVYADQIRRAWDNERRASRKGSVDSR